MLGYTYIHIISCSSRKQANGSSNCVDSWISIVATVAIFTIVLQLAIGVATCPQFNILYTVERNCYLNHYSVVIDLFLIQVPIHYL